MKLLLVLALVPVAMGQMLGQNKCTHGPAYWCSGISAAKECNAIEHCTTNIWKNMQVLPRPVGEDPACDVCETFIGDIRTILTNKTLWTQATALIDKYCHMIPDDAIVQLCLTEVKQELPVIENLIKENLNPVQICTAIGFCVPKQLFASSASSDDYLPVAAPLMLYNAHRRIQTAVEMISPPAMSCQDCKKEMTELKSQLKKAHTPQQGADMCIATICDHIFKGASEKCHKTLEQNKMALYFMVMKETPEKLCQIVHSCPLSALPGQMAQLYPATQVKELVMGQVEQVVGKVGNELKVGSSATCWICEAIVGELEKLLGDKKTEADIKKALDVVCSKLPSELSSECVNFVNTYEPLIISIIESESAEQVCSLIQACSGAGRPALLKQEEACYACRLIVNYLVGALNEKPTVAAIEQLGEKACGDLPGEYTQACKYVVERYTPALVLGIVEEASTLKVCQKVRICQPSEKQVQNALNPFEKFAGAQAGHVLEQVQGQVVPVREMMQGILPVELH